MAAESMMLADYRRNVYSVYHRDGLIDLAFGTIFLLLSISILTDTTLYSLFSGMVIFGYLYLKYVIISPRAGYARFHGLTRGALLFIIITVATLIIGFTLAVIYPDFPVLVRSSFQSFGRLIVGLVLMASFVAIGFLYGLVRFYSYAFFMFSVFTTAQLIGGEIWIDLGMIGAVLMISGAVLLRRFLKAHPLTGEVPA
jgi:hypothetical protein